MIENNENESLLLEKLNALLKRQDEFSKEIESLRLEITRLKTTGQNTIRSIEEEKPNNISEVKSPLEVANPQRGVSDRNIIKEYSFYKQQQKQVRIKQHKPGVSLNLEKFIGENLINKIGIVITVFGVAIGAKYSIDNNLISPLTRIILGYLFGLGLMGVGFKLKRNYENYSAVLVSGATTIMYFITYLSYSLYGLIPNIAAFVLMVIFTVFAVGAALNYNRQVIAHIGLVGAYAVPFLLSEGSGRVHILFSYMVIINLGILIIAFKKYWKPLYYSAFTLTWLIFLFWYESNYKTEQHFAIAITFLTIFFITFYISFLAYKLIQKEKFDIYDIILLITNSFVYFGLGYNILNSHPTADKWLGLYAICNALVHAIVSTVIYRQKLADKNLFYLVSGLVLVFIAIAIPVQLNGNWVTLLWAGEAALLFWIGRTKRVSFYELLSYPLMMLSFISIMHDWSTLYFTFHDEDPKTWIIPIWNINFLSSMMFIGSFVYINILNKRFDYSFTKLQQEIVRPFSVIIPGILLLATYYAFRVEISNYWHQLFINSKLVTKTVNDQFAELHYNYDLKSFKTVWIDNYSLLFIAGLAFYNLKKERSPMLGMLNLALITIGIIVFLISSLFVLSELRDSYLNYTSTDIFKVSVFNILIRYISYAFVSLVLFAGCKITHSNFMQTDFRKAFDILLYSTILWIVSSEYISLMEIAESSQSYKLGLSILWGTFSLYLIIMGIWKKKKHLRIGAIALFGVTLVKLFIYDISHLSTIAKTIVFVSLGVLLLVISFLYNKYNRVISE